VHRIDCKGGVLTRECHVLSPRMATEAVNRLGAATLLVVHSLFRAHALWAMRIAAATHRRYWAVPHGCLDPWGLRRRSLAKHLWLLAWGRAYLESAEAVVFSTRREQEKARAWLGGSRPMVVHWPVEVPDFHAADRERADFRRRYGIPESARVLLYVGRLHTMKRPTETIAAFCEANPAHTHLVVVGMDGDLTANAVRRHVPEKFAHRVHVVGGLSGHLLGAAYHAANGYISLSYRENFGYAAAEALAFGLPVILSPGHDLAYDMPMQSETLACGWLLPDDSRPAAVDAIRMFGEAGESTLRTIGDTGRRWSSDSLSFQRFQDVLSDTACRGSRR